MKHIMFMLLRSLKKKKTFLLVIESGGVGELTATIIAVVRCHSTVNEMAICYNKENEVNIKGGIKASVPASAKISCVSHHKHLPQKEREGFVFTADCRDTEMVVKSLVLWCGRTSGYKTTQGIGRRRPPLMLVQAGLET